MFRNTCLGCGRTFDQPVEVANHVCGDCVVWFDPATIGAVKAYRPKVVLLRRTTVRRMHRGRHKFTVYETEPNR